MTFTDVCVFAFFRALASGVIALVFLLFLGQSDVEFVRSVVVTAAIVGFIVSVRKDLTS